MKYICDACHSELEVASSEVGTIYIKPCDDCCQECYDTGVSAAFAHIEDTQDEEGGD